MVNMVWLTLLNTFALIDIIACVRLLSPVMFEPFKCRNTDIRTIYEIGILGNDVHSCKVCTFLKNTSEQS